MSDQSSDIKDLVATCIKGGLTKAQSTISENLTNVTQDVLNNTNSVTPPALFAAGLVAPQATLAASTVGVTALVAGGTLAATAVDAREGCVASLQQMQQQRINAHVAQVIAAQSELSPAQKLSAIQSIVVESIIPPQAVQEIHK